jgi:seryl-tRNA synthetase
MLDIQFIRDHQELVQKNADQKKHSVDITTLLRLDEDRRGMLLEVEELNSLKNSINDLIRSAANDEERQEIITKGKEIKEKLDQVTPKLKEAEEEYYDLLKKVPNIATEDTPEGKDDNENKIIRSWGSLLEDDWRKSHDELGKALGILDTETSAEVTGARFAYLKGGLVRLQFALIQFVLETVGNEALLKNIAEKNDLRVSTKPFLPVLPPVFIRPEVLDKMDRLEPRDDRYHLAEDNLYLTGSAEHTLGPIHMEEILPEKNLPLRYIGYGTAFRREAGTYGKDMKGLIRMHQFDKLEIESFTLPEDGLKEQDFIVAIQEYMLQELELPYQVMQVCTGDMGKPDARQIDINTWFPAQGTYRETHTSDYMTDYQARRLMTRVRREDGRLEYVHMNDATAFAMGRILAAIIENNQTKEGQIRVPQVLQRWTGSAVIG